MGKTKHKTVLLKETVDLLNIKDNAIYLDLTLGGGGHSLEILERLNNGKLISFDIDSSSIERFLENLKEEKKIIQEEKITKGEFEFVRIIDTKKNEIFLVNVNFGKIDLVLNELKINKVNGVIADLGWSSDQLGGIEGLSYQNLEEDLDMRFDKRLGVKASDLLNVMGRKQMKQMFLEYSDIYGYESNLLVDQIFEKRKEHPIKTVNDLISIIDEIANISRKISGDSNKFKSQVFQALRITVNSEFENLKSMIDKAFENLDQNGVLAIITFHSGEDKNLVEKFSKYVSEKKANYVSNWKGKNYIQPSVDELKQNIRARSAKLFAIEKI